MLKETDTHLFNRTQSLTSAQNNNKKDKINHFESITLTHFTLPPAITHLMRPEDHLEDPILSPFPFKTKNLLDSLSLKMRNVLI